MRLKEWRKRCAVYVHAVHQYQWEPAPFGWDYDAKSYESCLWAARQHAKREGVDFGLTSDALADTITPAGKAGAIPERWRYWRLPAPGNRFGVDARCEVVRCE